MSREDREPAQRQDEGEAEAGDRRRNTCLIGKLQRETTSSTSVETALRCRPHFGEGRLHLGEDEVQRSSTRETGSGSSTRATAEGSLKRATVDSSSRRETAAGAARSGRPQTAEDLGPTPGVWGTRTRRMPSTPTPSSSMRCSPHGCSRASRGSLGRRLRVNAGEPCAARQLVGVGTQVDSFGRRPGELARAGERAAKTRAGPNRTNPRVRNQRAGEKRGRDHGSPGGSRK